MNYTDALSAAIENATSAEAAYANLDAVVASASGLAAGDQEVVAGLASVGASSVAYWYDQAEAGNVGGGGTKDPPPEPYSIFVPQSCGFWCAARDIGKHDLIGGAGAAIGLWMASDGLASIWPQGILIAAFAGSGTSSIEEALAY